MSGSDSTTSTRPASVEHGPQPAALDALAQASQVWTRAALVPGLDVMWQMQQQWWQRFLQRQQEWASHCRTTPLELAGLDASLAALRWACQEWQQLMQDQLTAAVMWRGRQPAGGDHPFRDGYGQLAMQPWQGWPDLWAAVGHRPWR